MKLISGLSCILTLLIYSHLYAQTTIVKEYVNKQLLPAKQEEAAYFRIASVDADKNLTGRAEYYYVNNETYARNLYARGEYDKNEKVGKWEWWYINGQLKEVGYFEKKPTHDEAGKALKSELLSSIYKIESYWDSTGGQQVTEGNGKVHYSENSITLGKGNYQRGVKHGEWEGTYQVPDNSEFIQFKENYTYGKLLNGVSYDKDGKSYTYDVLETLPEPKGGINGLMRYLMNSLRYPTQARRKGIEGKVLVQFYVNKDGSISDVELLQGIGGGCDEEAIRVVKGCPKWTGAIHRGQQVKVRMTLPVVFKLG